MSLGEQIKEAREKKNLSQEELAERIGVSRQAVSKWENNTAIPHGINRETLAQVLELSLESDVIVQYKTPFSAWIGWIIAGVLALGVIAAAAIGIPLLLSMTATNSIITEMPVESLEIHTEPKITSIRFFDGTANEVLSDGGWYNTSDIENILISWTGGDADSIQMFAIPTGTETLSQTSLLETKAITNSESTALLNADVLHSDRISTHHLYFEVHIGDNVLVSDTFNVYYEE